ncbi:hypothetical protein Skr01_27850 [Sphaerisporangium krabiense]|nr:hypothetical protein Skr01_27850 [Sphaerisporangium krabiense]
MHLLAVRCEADKHYTGIGVHPVERDEVDLQLSSRVLKEMHGIGFHEVWDGPSDT